MHALLRYLSSGHEQAYPREIYQISRNRADKRFSAQIRAIDSVAKQFRRQHLAAFFVAHHAIPPSIEDHH